MKEFKIKPTIYFGPDSLDYLLSIDAQKVVIVTDPFMVKSDLINMITQPLMSNHINYTIFADVEPDPSIETITAGVNILMEESPSVVIALGGGSALDAAKAMIYSWLKMEKVLNVPEFIAIPTTSGTGSEVTDYSVITDTQKGVKIPLQNPIMLPTMTILDPNMTKSLPKSMIAYTGMDVLTHALEAYVSEQRNDFTNMFAVEATSVVFNYLPIMFSNVNDDKAREKMHNASTMAGVAFTNSSLGICHGIAHSLGAKFHIPHGKANAIILPYIIKFNAGLNEKIHPKILKRYANIACKIGLQGETEEQSCQMLIRGIEMLNETFEIPRTLASENISEKDFFENIDDLINKILQDACTKCNPVEINKNNLKQLLSSIYYGG